MTPRRARTTIAAMRIRLLANLPEGPYGAEVEVTAERGQQLIAAQRATGVRTEVRTKEDDE